MKTKYKSKKINGKKIDEHRWIMEKYLGRKLLNYEIVHHKNRNKSDNKLENLQLMIRSDHVKLHIKQGDLKLKSGSNKKKLVNGKLTCSRCKEPKELKEFWKNKNDYLGYNGVCKECQKLRRTRVKKK